MCSGGTATQNDRESQDDLLYWLLDPNVVTYWEHLLRSCWAMWRHPESHCFPQKGVCGRKGVASQGARMEVSTSWQEEKRAKARKEWTCKKERERERESFMLGGMLPRKVERLSGVLFGRCFTPLSLDHACGGHFSRLPARCSDVRPTCVFIWLNSVTQRGTMSCMLATFPVFKAWHWCVREGGKGIIENWLDLSETGSRWWQNTSPHYYQFLTSDIDDALITIGTS